VGQWTEEDGEKPDLGGVEVMRAPAAILGIQDAV